MNEALQMQDSGLALSRLLAGFLHIGVLLVDEAGICRFANAHACELLGAHVTGRADPAAARWFLLSRYDDPEYRARLERGEFSSGQL